MIDEVIKASKVLDQVEDYISTLPDQQSNCDSKLSDLYHYLENNKLNASQCCSFIKEMKKVVQERRKVKNEYEIGKVYKTYCNRLNSKDNRALLINELKKMEKKLEKEYKNRVYSDGDLIEIGIRKGEENE